MCVSPLKKFDWDKQRCFKYEYVKGILNAFKVGMLDEPPASMAS